MDLAAEFIDRHKEKGHRMAENSSFGRLASPLNSASAAPLPLPVAEKGISGPSQGPQDNAGQAKNNTFPRQARGK